METIGIDLSINSTGLCIVSDERKPRYYIITSKLSKRQKAFNHNRITILEYKKTDNLSINISEIGKAINSILEDNPDIDNAVIEDTALNASGRVVDLGILNGYVRAILDARGIPFTTVRPTSWKKEMIGNGMADKELTIASWKLMDPIDFKGIKIDDCADAYYLAQYGFKTK